MRKWFIRRSKSAARSATPAALRCEELEPRLTPVVSGSAALAPEAPFQDPYTGVVMVRTPATGAPKADFVGKGTGALLDNRFQILTAAHNIPGGLNSTGDMSVQFSLKRGTDVVPIDIKVPQNIPAEKVQLAHPNYVASQTSVLDVRNDIGVLTLTDQEGLVAGRASRLMIAPFGAAGQSIWTPLNALDKLTAKEFWMVGYGLSGNGENGISPTPVWRITVPKASTANAGFKLKFGNDTTAELKNIISLKDTDLANELAKLESLKSKTPNIGVAKYVDATNDQVIFDVRFYNGKFVGNVLPGNGLQIVDVNNANVVAFNPTSTAQVPGNGGGMPFGPRRTGANIFDVAEGNNLFSFDFDDNKAEHNSTGSKVPTTNESIIQEGDSGGPAFLRIGDNYPIGGVAINGWSFGTKDSTPFVLANGARVPDGSYGEVAAYIDAAPYAAWAKGLIPNKVTAVLDMKYQVVGLSKDKENITITVSKDNNDLVISLSGSGDYDGEYYRGPYAGIKEVLIRGTGKDTETVKVVDDMKLPIKFVGGDGKEKEILKVEKKGPIPNATKEPITFQAGAGRSELVIDDADGGATTYFVSTSAITADGGANFRHIGVRDLTVNGIESGDTVQLTDLAPPVGLPFGLSGTANRLYFAANVVSTATTAVLFELGAPATGGAVAGDDYDTIVVAGAANTVTADGTAQLGLIGGLPSSTGQQFTLIDNRTSSPISGTFTFTDRAGTALPVTTVPNALPVITFAGYTFTVNYEGGDGNDLVLTLASTPATTPAASISGTVWNDLDRDGVYDSSEPGAGGISVDVISTTSGRSFSVVTNGDGTYLASQLAAGSYAVFVNAVNSGLYTLTTSQSLTGINVGVLINVAPVTAADAATTNEDTSVTIAVLSNDADANGDTLAVQYASVGANGTTVVNANGTVSYTPDANWSGTDTFAYWVSDGYGGLTQGMVTVTVTTVNDAPVINNPSVIVQRDTPLDIDLRALVSDVETSLADLVFAVSNAVNGTVLLLADGYTARFTPASGYYGSASFSLSVTDTGDGSSPAATTTASVSAPVNAPPTVSGGSASVHAGESTTVYPYWSDPDGDTLTATVTNGAHGTVAADPYGYGFVYTAADPTYTGEDTFTVTVSDGRGGTATATFTIALTNTPPVASDVTFGVAAGTESVVIFPYPNAYDPDGDTLTVLSVSTPGSGSAGVNEYGQIVYLPPTGWTGTTTFTYTISDGHGGTATATVTITVS